MQTTVLNGEESKLFVINCTSDSTRKETFFNAAAYVRCQPNQQKGRKDNLKRVR